MSRLVIYASDGLQARLRERADRAGTAVSALAVVLLDQALEGYGTGSNLGPRSPEKMPHSDGLVKPGRDPGRKRAPAREPHVRRDRFKEKCETLELVDGVCPTCGYREE